MKSVLIVFNQVLSDELIRLLDELHIRGFTRWTGIHGRGSETGEPRIGSHTWPALNDALLCVIPESEVKQLLARVRAIDDAQPEQGLRAFVWNIEQAV